MSRMLNALKQIEAKHPQVEPAAVEPVSPDELVSFGLDRQTMPWGEPEAAAEVPRGDNVATAELPAVEEPVVPPPAPVREPAPTIPLHAEVPRRAAPERPANDYAPQYCELADAILDRCRTDRARALLFTSPGDGEGKTSTLVPVAAVLADRLRDEVLLVDANVRRPGLSRFFDLSSSLGLIDVLEGVGDWTEIVCKTSIPHLNVLPGSRIPADGQWTIPAIKFASLLNELRSQYRLVLIDTPSLVHPFAAPMAKHCEGVYLVVQLGHTSRQAVRQAVKVLEGNGGVLLGGIVTRG